MDNFLEWIESILSPFLTPPNSALFILAIATALTLVAIGANKVLTDVDQIRNYEVEVRQYMNELNEAKKRGDKKVILKLERREPRITMIQSIVAKQRMKTSLLLMLPFMALFFILNSLYGSQEPNIVAYLPFNLLIIPSELPFSTWYIICYFATYTLLNHLFGITFEMDETPLKTEKTIDRREKRSKQQHR